MSGWDRLQGIDRRWIFLVLLLVTAGPLMNPIGMPVSVGKHTTATFERIALIEEGETVLISWDFDPSSQAELLPTAEMILRQLFDQRAKVVVIALWPAAPSLAQDTLVRIAAHYPGVKEGEDWVNLGFKPGGDVVVKAMGDRFASIFPADQKGRSLSQIPVMAGIESLEDIALIIDLAAGGTVEIYVQQAVERMGTKGVEIDLVAAVTGVMIADYYPFLDTGQLKGLVGGLRGAAEYELNMGHKGPATKGMDAQSFAHVAIIFFILLGNLGHWLGSKPDEGPRLKALRRDDG